MTATTGTAHGPRLAVVLADRLPAVLAPLARLMPELSYYTIVSAVALGVDLVVFKSLILGGMRASIAGAVGYLAGLVLHYVLSRRYVFTAVTADKSRLRQFVEFALSGAVGLAITYAIIGLATDVAHAPALVGKIAAVGTSFIVVFLLRRGIVFAGRRGVTALSAG